MSADAGAGTIGAETRGRARWLIIERPGKLNSLSGDMREQLRVRIAEAARDNEVDALVISGAGTAFCAGGDVATMARLNEESAHGDFHGILHAGAECVLALQAFPGLTIAAIRGVAAGAGLALALNCDLRIAGQSARLAASWSGIGLAPDWAATYWLPQILGYPGAIELVIGGRVLESDEAVQRGLVHERVDDERIEERVEYWVQRAAARDMVRQVKYLLRKGIGGSVEASLAAETEAQEDLFASDDVAEGLRAFMEKRRPRFGRKE